MWWFGRGGGGGWLVMEDEVFEGLLVLCPGLWGGPVWVGGGGEFGQFVQCSDGGCNWFGNMVNDLVYLGIPHCCVGGDWFG